MASQNDTTTTEQNPGRTYYTWKCADHGDNEQRPNGQPISDACGKWGVKSSIYSDPSEAPHGLFATCRYGCLSSGGRGPRKTRLTASTKKFYAFPTRAEAQALADILNEQEGA